MIKSISIVVALCSIFFFPMPVTIGAALIASYVYIPMGFLVGLLYDATYGLSGGIAVGTLLGVGVSVFCFYTRKFVKDRVILS